MADTRIPNRKNVRYFLAKLLEGGAPGYTAIYPYENDDLGGKSPVLRIMSGTSLREPISFKGQTCTLGFTLQSLVLYIDDANNWTPQKAEDLLDDLEHQIATVILNVKFDQKAQIKSIQQAGASRIRKDVIQGKTYLTEYIPIEVEAQYGAENL